MTINKNEKSSTISTQLDSLIPISKISTLSQGVFVGAITDNNDERIEQKFFHYEIMVDKNKVDAETKAYQPIPQMNSFIVDGVDTMQSQIQDNYKSIKEDVKLIVKDELERIEADPVLQHLIQSK